MRRKDNKLKRESKDQLVSKNKYSLNQIARLQELTISSKLKDRERKQQIARCTSSTKSKKKCKSAAEEPKRQSQITQTHDAPKDNTMS